VRGEGGSGRLSHKEKGVHAREKKNKKTKIKRGRKLPERSEKRCVILLGSKNNNGGIIALTGLRKRSREGKKRSSTFQPQRRVCFPRPAREAACLFKKKGGGVPRGSRKKENSWKGNKEEEKHYDRGDVAHRAVILLRVLIA